MSDKALSSLPPGVSILSTDYLYGVLSGNSRRITVADLIVGVGIPSATTDNAVIRYDASTGLLQGSGVTIDDSDNLMVPASVTFGAAGRLNDSSAVIGSPATFWNPTYFTNPGTAKVHRLNRLFVGTAALGSSDAPMSTPDWLETTFPASTQNAQLSAVSAIGTLGVVGGARTCDFFSWAGSASGGSQGVSGFGLNDDTSGVFPIAVGVYGLAIRNIGVGGATENEFTVANAGSIVDLTPYSGVLPGSTLGINISAGYSGYTANCSAGLIIGTSVTATFRKGIIVFDDLDTSVGVSAGGVAIELARNQEVRWVNSGATTDTTMWGSAGGLFVNSALLPAQNDIGALGSTSLKWSDVFLASGAVINFNSGNITLTHSAGDLALAGGTLTLPNTGLHLLDTNASHDLIIVPGSDLTVDRNLTITTGDAARTVTLNGNPTLNDWFDQDVKTTSSPSFGPQITTGVGVSTGDAKIELGGSRTGDGNVYIDFHAVASTDYECRFLRLGGVNGAASFANTGTGDFSFTQEGAGAFVFKTSNTPRMTIAAGGGTDHVGLFQTDSLRIDQAVSTIGTGVKTISNAADSSTNFGKYFIFDLNGTTVYVPCGTVAPT
jgi:hypothetical protein